MLCFHSLKTFVRNNIGSFPQHLPTSEAHNHEEIIPTLITLLMQSFWGIIHLQTEIMAQSVLDALPRSRQRPGHWQATVETWHPFSVYVVCRGKQQDLVGASPHNFSSTRRHRVHAKSKYRTAAFPCFSPHSREVD